MKFKGTVFFLQRFGCLMYILTVYGANAFPGVPRSTVSKKLEITNIQSKPKTYAVKCQTVTLTCETSLNFSMVWWQDAYTNFTDSKNKGFSIYQTKLDCSDEIVKHSFTCNAAARSVLKEYITATIDLEIIELPRIEELKLHPSGPDSVILFWKEPEFTSLTGEILNDVEFYYNVIVMNDHESNKFLSSNNIENENGMKKLEWSGLQEQHHYSFMVEVCLDNNTCGEHIGANILLRVHPSPQNVSLTCKYDNVSLHSILNVVWETPQNNYADRTFYQVELNSSAEFIDSNGTMKLEHMQELLDAAQSPLKEVVKANTNYSVKVSICSPGVPPFCGRKSSLSFQTTCSTPVGVPSEFPKFELARDESNGGLLLKLLMQRISERFGPIKCYQVILYKLKSEIDRIPQPQDIEISTYDLVHQEDGFGAYVAESFKSENFQNEVMLGDGKQSKCSDYNQRHSRSVVSDSSFQPSSVDELIKVQDGQLSSDTKYTGFVEVIVVDQEGKELYTRSDMFPPVRTGTNAGLSYPTALGIICGLLAVVIILAVALCILRRKGYSTRQETPIIPQHSMKPISREELVTHFVNKHKDSDFLFQRDYEMLPEYFPDRTTKASDSVENFFKNRYPDIKAYDQTRVKLSPINGSPGSDYINGNFVQGYQGKKQFICAQGPIDKTVNDFWRMIWEHKVEIIAMVTGLEENGKVKCAKYWSEDEDVHFDNIVVSVTKQDIFGEFAIRHFHVTYKEDDQTTESRKIIQYHYLVWKDFLAPDYPGGILRFIKRINEVYTLDKGPLLIHCSAGVGRTGTLVVLDSMLTQLKDEGYVDVFNFITEIRKQRNFMVQSLTQYIFIFRALMEFAQFGDTEIDAANLKTKLGKLVAGSDNGKSLMQCEFEKLDEVIEDYKTTDVGTMDINMNKNRYDYIIPFDRNRVVLSSLPNQELSTYINASFIQGYERLASYIITQDPLSSTTGDFWRMIMEHCVPIIVMLSDMGEGQAKCQKYWPETEEEFLHIKVSLKQCNEKDGYLLRIFEIINTKTSKSHEVLHVQFLGWEDDNQVPVNSQEILNFVQAVHKLKEDSIVKEPIAVHCSGGGDRSSLFVTLSILILQLTAEKRVDIFQVARNLRTQRKFMIQSLSQYHFLYSALAEFVTKNF